MFKIYIGLRGSGKSTFAAKISRKYIKKGIKVYSNFPLADCYLYDISDLGKYDISNGVLILDEAGIDINNRNYKSMSKDIITWIKLSRHYGVNDIYVFSQAFDFDVTFRRLADRMFLVKKFPLCPLFSFLRPVLPSWGIDSEGQPIIQWKIPRLFIPRFIFRPFYYKFFDSYSTIPLPSYDFDFIDHVDDFDIRKYILKYINILKNKKIKEFRSPGVQHTDDFVYIDEIVNNLEIKD